jgi:uncharacterized membrane protein (UPF0127 family)
VKKSLVCNSKKIVDVFIADTFISRFLGYMFQKKPHYEAILIKPCNSIHTFFMKFDIDVLFLNKNMEVIQKIECLPKGKVIMPVKDAMMVIEAKTGMFDDVKQGEKISFM